jgi:selenocysteine lyase/cysteine desulfurase
MIYLDHAATSWPKPAAVLGAVHRWYAELGVSAERGDSGRCAEVRAVVDQTRRALGRMCGVPDRRVAFTSGATESINLWLRGVLRRGDRVLTTALEHSSLVRPLTALRDELELRLDVLPPDHLGRIDLALAADRLAADGYRLFAFSHATNVVGTVLPAAELCAEARSRGCLTLLDAAQSAGLLPLDVGADAVAASAHKALLGPPGLGFLAVRDDVEVRGVKQGGTGSSRAVERHPDAWPAAMEAGTPNTPAIFGLRAALALHSERAGDALAQGLALVDALRERLRGRTGLRLLGPEDGARVPIQSFTLDDLDPAEAGALLAEAGIHVRTGFHCAPWIHQHLGTAASGTVRVSFGPGNTLADVDALAAALSHAT